MNESYAYIFTTHANWTVGFGDGSRTCAARPARRNHVLQQSGTDVLPQRLARGLIQANGRSSATAHQDLEEYARGSFHRTPCRAIDPGVAVGDVRRLGALNFRDPRQHRRPACGHRLLRRGGSGPARTPTRPSTTPEATARLSARPRLISVWTSPSFSGTSRGWATSSPAILEPRSRLSTG